MEETIKNKEGQKEKNLEESITEKEGESSQGKENLKEIPEKDEQAKSDEALRKIDQSDVQDEEKRDWNQEISDSRDANEKIEKLARLASVKGPQEAIKMAKKLNENYSLDKLHDEMVDESKLREELIKKGFIQED
ncbi:MAG: hypothetical protein ACOCUF_00790 [Patescibacteria group bacterium]